MREYLLISLTAAVVTYLLTPAVRLFAVRFGAMTEVRDRDVHAIPTPRLGGLAMFGGMVAALIVAAQLPEMRKVFLSNDTGRALLLAGGLIVLIGVADDRWGVDALTKFAGQVAAAGLLIMNGVQLLWLPTRSGEVLSLPPAYGVPLTVFIVVATINAVNFVDGLDGLAAGVVGIAAMASFSYAYLISATNGLKTLTGAALITAILMGMCAGFLAHNFNPARIFMGDTGSMLIGLMLSASTIMLTGQFDTAIVGNYNLFPAFVPLLLVPAVITVPFIDMSLAVWRRTNQGRSPFAPDKQHLHHRLLELGHSHRRAVLIMYFWVGLLASCMVGLSFVRSMPLVFGVTGAVAVAGVVGMIAVPRLRASREPAPAEVLVEQPRQPV
ncbi:glycosyltransferase family 4 protein [Actinomadura alba]|uniref:Undecaprenyl/decaprenyl-phosphate alpha-N-acetylglucosaminyl 1-phosphate transferase n=1 Tax=Actinomadura alba TaxID=406431 RepID=A0ABR7LMF7_9ACTN|nr:MraY family glycosyltransferase [Actinomadura alba]MBC6465888.1 undecaprenyl/decaprenyl-phosphate alpha-N-acetylglucosaminyl 1-phosphate transferase [Actinomadura alba]